MEQHKQNTILIGERYETGLLHHSDYFKKKLRSNKSFAYNHLVSLEKRLHRDPALADLYKDKIQELLTSNRAQRLNPMWDAKEELLRVGGRLHYTNLTEETKHPIILPSHNRVVDLLSSTSSMCTALVTIQVKRQM
ncbi:hypothetical protein GQR58_021517 [Nymphon striatum]|nr:hypothetical protein GQR58_021517 [Nymphon striatum]